MSIEHYDRQGNPIELLEWARLLDIPDYKKILSSHLPGFWVSTVWLGTDHSFGDAGPPLIFETMIFTEDDNGNTDFADLYCTRCTTEEQARQQHCEALEWLLAYVQGEVARE